MRLEKSADTIVGRLAAEGLNRQRGAESAMPMRAGEPEKKLERAEANSRGDGRKPEAARDGGSNFPVREGGADSRESEILERVLERGNMLKALQAVTTNRGAAGVDGLEAGVIHLGREK